MVGMPLRCQDYFDNVNVPSSVLIMLHGSCIEPLPMHAWFIQQECFAQHVAMSAGRKSCWHLVVLAQRGCIVVKIWAGSMQLHTCNNRWCG